jgi:hypothetical protein
MGLARARRSAHGNSTAPSVGVTPMLSRPAHPAATSAASCSSDGSPWGGFALDERAADDRRGGAVTGHG